MRTYLLDRLKAPQSSAAAHHFSPYYMYCCAHKKKTDRQFARGLRARMQLFYSIQLNLISMYYESYVRIDLTMGHENIRVYGSYAPKKSKI